MSRAFVGPAAGRLTQAKQFCQAAVAVDCLAAHPIPAIALACAASLADSPQAKSLVLVESSPKQL